MVQICQINEREDLPDDVRNHVGQLYQENRQFRFAIEASNTGLFMLDPKQDGNPIVFVNEAFSEMVGAGTQQLMGMSWVDMVLLYDDVKISDQLASILADNAEPYCEFAQRGIEGEVIWYDLSMTPVYSDDGMLDLLVGVQNDITKLKQRRARSIREEKLEAIGRLSSGISHDFNNILSIIQGYSQLLKGYSSNMEDVPAGYLKKIDEAGQRGAELTSQLLSFTRQKSGGMSFCNLQQVLEQQVSLLRPLLHDDIKLQLYVPDQDIHLMCDAQIIGPIIMNIVLNGRDAMADDGTISVSVKEAVHEDLPDNLRSSEIHFASIVISDTGSGMPDHILEQIFDPFFTTKKQGKGTGLGLAMAYSQIKELGGDVIVSSKEGQGTTVRLYLPMTKDVPEMSSSQEGTICEGLSISGLTILVAEDEPDLRNILRTYLESKEATVLMAENGNDALLKQDQHEGEIDVLVTDIVMPELNGVRLAELFSSVRPDAKIIYMSGYPSCNEMEENNATLPEDACFLAKPLNPDDLEKVIISQIYDGGNHECRY